MESPIRFDGSLAEMITGVTMTIRDPRLDDRRSRTRVVLIHGVGAKPITMWLLNRRLRQAGWNTELWGYRSVGNSIETHAQRFGTRLQAIEDDPSVDRIHVVAHSMGGIITRCLLLNRRLEKLERVVMLGPPNHGSLTARWLSYGIHWLCPALHQLSSHPTSFVRTLPQPEQGQWGVLAATRDRVVSIASSRLEREHEHGTIPTGHMRMLLWRRTAELTHRFLDHGTFAKLDSGGPQVRDSANEKNASVDGAAA